MPLSFSYLPYSDTGHFSALVTDYLQGAEAVKPFYTYRPDATGIGRAIEERKNFPVDRQLLVATLKEQYGKLPEQEAVNRNIALLLQENTFSICTAHQPNLMTGYLYFVYKIVHAIKLAEELKQLHPEQNFVPVYYMGSEDNDLDELGTFRYADRKFVWDAGGQQGAVGRMDTSTLKPLIADLLKLLGPPGPQLEELKDIITNAYLKHKNISDATQHLVHALFGRFGLVVINPDDAGFKRTILSIMKDDLLKHTPYTIVSEDIDKLGAHYKVQAHPRAINLFYLKDGLRERIEKRDDNWQVLNTDISWNEQELLQELEAHPERFSPNVILRGIFQETILPDVAFIGGGAEVAYWLQLKGIFSHYKTFYPAIVLRQSVMWADAQAVKLRRQLGLSVAEIFAKELDLIKRYITSNSKDDWQTEEETASFENILEQLKGKAVLLDPTLRSSADAALTKIKHQLQVLERKMYRAEKRKMQIQLQKISKLKAMLFPANGLQERIGNFLPYYLQYGKQYFDTLKDAIKPLNSEFLVIEDVEV